MISLYRCFDLGDIIALLHGKPKTPYTPVKKELREAAGGLAYLMGLQGMILLLSPNVGGWEWGKAWINPAISIERIKLGSFVFLVGRRRPLRWLPLLAARILQDDKPTNPEQLVIAMADILTNCLKKCAPFSSKRQRSTAASKRSKTRTRRLSFLPKHHG